MKVQTKVQKQWIAASYITFVICDTIIETTKIAIYVRMY